MIQKRPMALATGRFCRWILILFFLKDFDGGIVVGFFCDFVYEVAEDYFAFFVYDEYATGKQAGEGAIGNEKAVVVGEFRRAEG